MIEHKLFLDIIFSLTLMTVFNTADSYSQSTSVIGLKVEFSAPKGPVEYADRIYFVKLQEDINDIKVDSILQSNFQFDNQIYLTDLEPGKYALVAIGKKKVLPIYGLTDLTTFFSEELIKENIVTLDSNDFVYIGDYSLTTKMMVSNKKSDDAQLHYFKLISGRETVPRYMRQVSLDTWFYKAGLENLDVKMTNKNDFYTEALKHFQCTELERIIKTKIK